MTSSNDSLLSFESAGSLASAFVSPPDEHSNTPTTQNAGRTWTQVGGATAPMPYGAAGRPNARPPQIHSVYMVTQAFHGQQEPEDSDDDITPTEEFDDADPRPYHVIGTLERPLALPLQGQRMNIVVDTACRWNMGGIALSLIHI